MSQPLFPFMQLGMTFRLFEERVKCREGKTAGLACGGVDSDVSIRFAGCPRRLNVSVVSSIHAV